VKSVYDCSLTNTIREASFRATKPFTALIMVAKLFKPLAYRLEKAAVSRIIPDATSKPHRKPLKDYPLQESPVLDHSLWTALLQRHVSVQKQVGTTQNTRVVDYTALSKDSDFDKYIHMLETTNPDLLPPAEQLAFWMNAYNAFCIGLIVNHERTQPPLQSINDLTKGMPVWDQVAGTIHCQDVTLNHIEHEHSRAKWGRTLYSCLYRLCIGILSQSTTRGL